METPGTASVRVGVIVDPDVEAWAADVVRGIASVPGAELVLVAADASTRTHRRRAGLFELYARLDRRVFGGGRDPLLTVPLDRLALDGAHLLESDGFDELWGERVRGDRLDVILHLGSARLDPGIEALARHGVWSIGGGSAAACFALVASGPGSAETVLLARRQGGASEAILRSTTAIDPVSLHRTRARTLAKAPALVRRGLALLVRDGAAPTTPHAGVEPAPPAPSGLAVAAFLVRLAPRLARRWLERFRPLDWFVGYRRRDETTWRVLPQPSNRFYADPFLFERAGRTFLFFEDYSYRAGSGTVSYVELDAEGRPSEPRPALVRPYHLSYPLVFERDGEVYMLPETVEAGEVELFRATRFPDEWELHRVLLPGTRGADPTLFEHSGRLWLFVNVPESDVADEDELSLFFADSLDGPWQPHPGNPVVSDVRGARGAGAVFERDGILIRPGQEAATERLSVLLHAIVELSVERYEERVIERVGPEWHPRAVGAHTWNESEQWVAVDGYRRPFKSRWTRRVR